MFKKVFEDYLYSIRKQNEKLEISQCWNFIIWGREDMSMNEYARKMLGLL